MVNRKKGCKVLSSLLKRFARKARIPNPCSCSLLEAPLNRDKAQTEFLAGLKEAPTWRRSSLKELASRIAKDTNKDPETIFSQLTSRERQRDQWNRIRTMRKKLRGGKFFKLYKSTTRTIPGPNGTLVEITGKIVLEEDLDMEAGLQEEFEHRFTEALDTPPMQEPLRTLLGLFGDTNFSNQVLDGTAPLADMEMDPYARLLLQAMVRPANVLPLSPTTLCISAQDNTTSWKTQRLNTTSEPSTLGFPHYITGAYHPQISETDAALRSAPFQLGFGPSCWKVITDFPILKKAKVFDISKMCCIQLMDALFNINNKKMGRDAMSNAERQLLLPDEQAGSRHHRSAPSGLWTKVLLADLSRIQRIPMAIPCLDARQCYDRIAHNMLSLALQRLGMPIQPIRSMLEVLQDAKHYPLTAYGPSSLSYGGPARSSQGLDPLMGPGQGNGMAPMGYVFLSAVIVAMLESAGFHSTFVSAISQRILTLVCVMFVDDADLFVTALPASTHTEFLTRIQSTVNHWTGGLRATGGAIRQEKSYWFLLEYNQTKWQPTYLSNAQAPGNILLPDEQGLYRTIPRKEPHQSEVTLGMAWSPARDMTGQMEHFKGKITEFTGSISCRSFSDRNDVWLAFKAGILKTLEYPVLACSLSLKQWNSLLSPLLKKVLPLSGMSTKFPHKLIWGSHRYCSFNLVHPWYIQELSTLCEIIDSVNKLSLNGTYIRALWESLKLEWCSSLPITSIPKQLDPLITDCSLKTTYQTLRSWQMTLFDNIPNPHLFRDNDRLLGDALTLQSTALPPSDLLLVKQVRMFAGYATLADITTADGKHIRRTAWNLAEDRDTFCLHQYTWPTTPPTLTAQHRHAWKTALTSALLQAHTSLLTLQHPLGQWQRIPHRWPWRYDPVSHQVLHLSTHQDMEYQTTYTCRQGLRRSFTPLHTETRSVHSITLPLATIVPNLPGLHITLESHGPLPNPEHTQADESQDTQSLSSWDTTDSCSTQVPTMDLSAALHPLPAQRWWMVDRLLHTDNGSTLITALQQGTAIACSDGSYQDGTSTSAFTLQGPTDEGRIDAVNWVPGDPDDQSSYRAELGGILGILFLLEAILLANPIIANCSSLSITISLDNKSAITSCQKGHPKASNSCYDLLLDIHRRLQALPISITWHWVESHQREQGKTMDRWARLNDEMDTQAKEHLNRCKGQSNPNQPLPSAQAYLFHQGKVLSRVHTKTIYCTLVEPELKKYWAEKTGMHPGADEFIDWPALGKAKANLSAGLDRWLIKHCSGHCGTAYKLHQRNYMPHSRCPLCEAPVEDIRHLLRCPEPRATALWKEQLLSLEVWMKGANTKPSIRKLILKGLQHWHSTGTDLPAQPSLTEQLYQCSLEQLDIGWFNLLLGRLSKRWSKVQDLHFRTLGTRHSGHVWAKGLILELWLINWNIWDYRNNRKHTEDTPEAQALLLNLQDQVRQEFQTGNTDLLPAHKKLLTTVSLVFCHHRTIPSLQEWLTRIQTARTLAITIATQKAIQAQQAVQATHDLLEPSRKFF